MGTAQANCPYGRCTMVNLCKGDHCVRAELEKAGWTTGPDGQMQRKVEQKLSGSA
jgi:hypothetical protein